MVFLWLSISTFSCNVQRHTAKSTDDGGGRRDDKTHEEHDCHGRPRWPPPLPSASYRCCPCHWNEPLGETPPKRQWQASITDTASSLFLSIAFMCLEVGSLGRMRISRWEGERKGCPHKHVGHFFFWWNCYISAISTHVYQVNVPRQIKPLTVMPHNYHVEQNHRMWIRLVP